MYLNKLQIFFKSLSFVVLISVSFTGVIAQSSPDATEKFIRALRIVNFAYVDPVDDGNLVEDAIRGMLRELDPHSVYLSAEELREANEPLIGSFDGIGVQFNIINDTIVVVSPVPGGPSEKVGILPGDKIVTIDGERSTGSNVNNNFVMQRLRGERGTRVDVSIYRRGARELLDFTITRDQIPINSMDAAFMATPQIGYIKLNRFSRTTMREFRDALSDLMSQGMIHLILDLNYNSGGFLDVAIDLADQFLERNKLIVYTEGNASPTQTFNSTNAGNFKTGKLVVLINEGSASASEIVAGAVQDWDRGLLVGRRSFGKGLVQRPFELPDGSAIRLTTARYHTPTGRSIQKPYEDGTESYYQDLSDRLRSGELVSAENIKFPDSLKYFTKINKREVYGGGGIMPDFFIPLDTNSVSSFYSKLLRTGAINTFSIEYANENRERLLRTYSNIDNYLANFNVESNLLERLYSHASNQGIEREEDEIGVRDEYMELQLKALIARSLWDFSAFIQVRMQSDEAYLRAIEIIQEGTFDQMKVKYK
ncbi:MAG: S41 family peptidase [Bacteroidales bacterium]|nr:S41 family peptidase [Bacteroidales bacterium]